MTRSINYKDNPFERANLTPMCGKPTSKTLHKLQNSIKENANSIYPNLGGGAHGHIGLMITDAQYALILPTPLICLMQQGPLIIPEGTTYHTNSNMWVAHTKKVCLFR